MVIVLWLVWTVLLCELQQMRPDKRMGDVRRVLDVISTCMDGG
jgi:hypothetical protein